MKRLCSGKYKGHKRSFGRKVPHNIERQNRNMKIRCTYENHKGKDHLFVLKNKKSREKTLGLFLELTKLICYENLC